jgi:hypothetical protein
VCSGPANDAPVAAACCGTDRDEELVADAA